jgi:hypothetical protein
MDENREAQVEQEEDTLDEGLADAFEDSWSEDEGLADDDDEMLGGEEATDAQPEPEAGEDEPTETEGDEGQAGEPEEKAEDQRFHLKHNGEETDVSLEEVIELAQKGMDYDNIRGERDTFRRERDEVKAERDKYKQFLEEVRGGQFESIDDFMLDTRARIRAERNGTSFEAEFASEQANQYAAKNNANGGNPVEVFMQRFPGVKAEDIPDSVWAETKETGDLAGAYARYIEKKSELDQKDAEIKRLQEKISALEQNQKNRDRSAGSSRSASAGKTKSTIAELWDNDE